MTHVEISPPITAASMDRSCGLSRLSGCVSYIYLLRKCVLELQILLQFFEKLDPAMTFVHNGEEAGIVEAKVT